MRFVSPLLKRVIYPALSGTGYLRHYAERGNFCIVTYHGVRPDGYVSIDPVLDGGLVTSDAFRSQLCFLKSHYCVGSPDEVLVWLQGKGDLPHRAVLLTCDDGLGNVVSEMLPILEQEEVRCLFFVTGDSLNE